MAARKRERLARLVSLQGRLKALHEARHAAHLSAAAAAQGEAEELAKSLEAPDGVATLFPDLFHERIGRMLTRSQDELAGAAEEASKIAAARARADVVERAYAEAMRQHEREADERAVLEMLEQRFAGRD